jgi:hypothetical protein
MHPDVSPLIVVSAKRRSKLKKNIRLNIEIAFLQVYYT